MGGIPHDPNIRGNLGRGRESRGCFPGEGHHRAADPGRTGVLVSRSVKLRFVVASAYFIDTDGTSDTLFCI